MLHCRSWMLHRRQFAVWLVGVSLTACQGPPPAGPPALVCTADNTTQLSLAVGAYEPVNQPCVAVGANGSATDSTEYLVVAQSAADTPGVYSAFQLQGSALGPSSMMAQWRAGSGARAPVAVQFDHFLRDLARSPRRAAALRPGANALARPLASPPMVGSSRSFEVCATLTCSSFAQITGTAAVVSGHVAIYVDPGDVASGYALDSASLDSLGQTFDQHVYAGDTAAFGRESDIDGNSVVAVLMTHVVNKLVSTDSCIHFGYIAGFFFPGDLIPGYAYQHTPGEVMYTVVPDSTGTLSCAHTSIKVERVLPPVLAHELEHMINFNQHVLVLGAQAEQTWLDEALAKHAEELAGRTFLPGDSATFYSYTRGELIDAYMYLEAPELHYLVTPTDQNLGDVGAGWLFLRYVFDQFGDSLSRHLVATASIGAQNVATQTGYPFPLLVGQWALANWVSDLPGFAAPHTLQYTSWRFRSTFAAEHAQNDTVFVVPFPLVPHVTMNANVNLNLSGVLKGGSGIYVRCLQPPGGSSFTLVFDAPGPKALAPVMAPQLDIVRIR
jgi:hypothetical protein